MSSTCLTYDLHNIERYYGSEIVDLLIRESPYISRVLAMEDKLLRAENMRPVRAHKPWTIQEDKQLMEDERRGVCVGQTALELKRSIGAIESRRMKLNRVKGDKFYGL